MKLSTYALMVALLSACGATARAEVWQPTAGAVGANFWSIPGNWLPATVPDGVGDSAVFNKVTTGVDNITVDGNFTVGSILIDMTGSTSNNDRRFVADIITPGSLTFDNGGAGATITTLGAAPPGPTEPNVDFEVGIPLVFNDNVTVIANQSNNTSAAGSVNFVAPISGMGGVTKQGPGTMTYILGTAGAGAKTYTGPTDFQAGKIRLRNNTAVPTMSSSVRIRDGSWVEPAATLTMLQLGAGTVFLNGDGIVPGFDAPGGAIRPERSTTSGAIYTMPNDIVLESDSVLHLQTQNDTSLGSMTLNGVISGPGQLQLTHFAHNEQIGSYILTNDNTYTGGTELRAGTLRLSGASADLGSGDVNVLDGRFLADRITVINGAATSRLVIESGVANAIDDTASLTLGGGFVGAAKAGFAELGAGVVETVSGLILGATPQTMAGTYGSTSSTAMFQSAALDEFFTGTGVINLVLPPMDDADFDGDGDVDGNDFLVLQRNIGTGTMPSQGDADMDGDVDGTDLGIFRNQFGETGHAVPAVGAIPEPAPALLALLAAPLGLLIRRKRLA